MTSRTLADAIQAEGLSGTAEEIRSAFNSDVALPFNTELWTYNGVATQFGTSAAEGLGAAIKAAGLEVAYITYATIGFDLSLDQTQEQLETLGNAVPELANLCATMKAIGRPLAKRWQRVGLESLPSEAEIQAALDIINAPVVYDRRQVLLSLNRGSDDAVVVRVQAATSDGRVGDVLATIVTADASSAVLNGPEAALVAAIRAAVDAYLETI